ncbi:MAG: helix-hairpin-helix domain-containing protein [Peptococcaceae bacterium]|jgi:hypothetical protein|nr:helix-hairpin-helix domain-containing protein [Peptococcaceae bacterium]
MPDPGRETVLKQFRRIPGVGKVVAADLYDLGFRSVEELRGRDPEEIYLDHCRRQGCKVDRCMLYVFRCAVYFASHEEHDPELMKWWNWKD